MHLLIRLDSLAHPRAGIGYYTENLVRTLIKEHPDLKVTGYFRGQLLEGAALQALLDDAGPSGGTGSALRLPISVRLKSWLRAVPGAYPARQAWVDWRSRPLVKAVGADLYHEPNYIPMPFEGPTVITVHDVSHIRCPEYHPRERVAYLNRYLPPALEKADQIITVSEFVRTELMDLYPQYAHKITAIHLGVEDVFHPRSADETTPILQKWGLAHGGYLFSSATLEPRKNIAGLVRAYQSLPDTLKAATPLVLSGGKGWKNHELEQLVTRATSGAGRVVLTGRVSRSDLAHLMAGCKLFAFPSFYEGFGLPIAEAKASGVPVLTSDRGAMKEVAGQGAILVDPEEFSEALKTALLSHGENSKDQTAYSWTKTACLTKGVYERAIAR